MRRKLRFVWMLMALMLSSGALFSQVNFTMRDTTVTACDGILTDSEAGAQPGTYGHNENFSFTICPNGSIGNILLSFSSFTTEPNLDYLRIFSGTDTTGTLLAGPYSGSGLPPSLNFSGCITINFISDGSVAGQGWIMSWTAMMNNPVPTSLALAPVPPTCSTATMTATLGERHHCDSLLAGNFTISGPAGQVITPTPIGCTNDSTDQVQLNFSPGLDLGGVYILNYDYWFRDACDSLWQLTSADTFLINDCPLSLQLTATQDTVCPGECVDILAIPNGGDSLTYAYNWTPAQPATAGPHTVCPTTTTTYSVTVSDASPSPSVTGSITITVLPPPNAQGNVSICESSADFNLSASPGGGIWNGTGITDTITGLFSPSTAGPGVYSIRYYGPNGCYDSLQATVEPIDAGPDQSACPGSPAFTVSGGIPAGGTWSGPNITAGGIFTPPGAGGIYVVTYTAGSCSDTKTIFVQNISIPPDSNMCASADTFTIPSTPPGGTWTGSPGVTAGGFFDPSQANTGPNQLVYSIAGCTDTFNVDIIDIDAGNNETACPKEAPFTVLAGQPAGGTWSGPGILNGTTGLFDPNINGQNYNALLTYSVNGCTDEKYVYVRVTDLFIDTVQFCRQAAPWPLNYTTTNRNVWGGTWAGTGVTVTTSNGLFEPQLAGPGYHALYYTANTCTDSLIAHVLPPKTLTDTTVCEFSGPFSVSATPADPQPGGVWTGPGITDPQGIFDPQVTGVGTFDVFYESFFGCPDTTTITVEPLDSIQFNGLAPAYCFKDTLIQLSLIPSGGIISGPGLVNDSVFNPSLAGQGTHIFTYETGTGACRQSIQVATTVRPPLQLNTTISDDSICQGESAVLTVASSGGLGGFAHVFNWDNGLPPALQHTVSPSQTTDFIVILSDGCSDPVSDTMTITVNQPFTIDFDTSSILCYGDTGWAVVLPSIPGNFSYEWDTDPVQTGDTVFAPVALDYSVVVTNLDSDCDISGTVTIPGYSRINANFLSNPAECATMDDPEISFIDLSTGATVGFWDYGDGAIEPYSFGTNPSHIYPTVGTFVVSLFVENDGGCVDEDSIEVCVEAIPVHVYNTFTPNGDGVNETLEIDGLEIYPNNVLTIYNRFGNVVYMVEDYQNDWDGTNQNGGTLPDGAYFYILDLGEPGEENKVGDVVIMR